MSDLLLHWQKASANCFDYSSLLNLNGQGDDSVMHSNLLLGQFVVKRGLVEN